MSLRKIANLFLKMAQIITFPSNAKEKYMYTGIINKLVMEVN
jgi:hypothetical protein